MTLYSEEISRLKREFEDIQKMILGQEQVWWISSLSLSLWSAKKINEVKTKGLPPDASFLIPVQVLDQASQSQATVRTTYNRLMRDMQNHLTSIKLLNQSLVGYLDRVEAWKDVIEETEEKMKTLTEDQYDIKATAHQVNTTVALR